MVIGSVHKSWRSIVPVVVVLATGLLSCRGSDANPDTTEMVAEAVEGECRDVFGSEVCTWATFSGTRLVEFGVTFPMQVVENVPADMLAVWPPAAMAFLALPDEAEELTGFTHFELNWEHHGHPPETFLEPHFDFHFYGISSEDLDAIDCTDKTKPEKLPPDYVLPAAVDPEHGVLTGLCVPVMGMHAMRQGELESSEPFTATVLIGYYGGDLIFVEPMVSRSTLLEEKSFSLDIPPLAGLAETIRYPTRFHAEFDQSSRTYRMVLSEFAAR